MIIDAGRWIAPSLRHCSVGGRWPLRAAVPHLQRALAEKATIDLKPFASNAQKKIAAVIADFQKNEDGIRVDAEISSLRAFFNVVMPGLVPA